jgi:hypothetical protein
MASSSTSTLSPWERLPDEILLQVLGHVMLRGFEGLKRGCGALRGVSRQWRAVHDAGCQRLFVLNGVTDEVMHALCGRLPALSYLNLYEVRSLTADGLRAVGGLTMLDYLDLCWCSNVTDAVLRELRGHTELTELYLTSCSDVTDVGVRELRGLTALFTLSLNYCTNVTNMGLQHLESLTALTKLYLHGTSTTQAGRKALKAALPTVAISPI